MSDAALPASPQRPAVALLAPARPAKGMRREVLELIVKHVGGPAVRDILFLLPTGAIDRRNKVSIADAPPGEIVTLEVEVDAHFPSPSAKAPYRVRLRDETGFLTATYFRPQPEMLKRMWPVGQRRIVSGVVESYNGERQMLHPDHVADPERGEAPPAVEPVYPLTAGLPLRALSRAVQAALPALPVMPEWLDAATIAQRKFMGFSEALRALHQPESPEDVAGQSPYRARLAYDELFIRQCALRLRRAERRAHEGEAICGDGRLGDLILASLPFAPTNAQIRARRDIAADIGQPTPMLRLLQGDVGSGKTLVAALAMAQAAEAGFQSALMAPTEILARQHGATLLPLLEAAKIPAAILTGSVKGKERKAILKGLAEGHIAVVIGTHALFQDEVAFQRLGLVVIDEQHRFGVSDRMRLVSKGKEPHVLVMSATPIPRTLALAVHGDMDISVLDEKPPGRQPIRTIALPTSRADELVESIAGAAQRGERAYWVCPLIQESEAIDLAAVEERFETLKARFGESVAIVHGKMSTSAREAAMDRFKRGEAFVLVATTVIEVGVNVPEATIIVIEHAERFGLAQLHQLRGRVGRGDLKSSCVLLWRPPLGELAKERLDTLRRTDDGFVIAEVDYKMRGAGDILGVRQSGLPPFRFVIPEVHGEMLTAADHEARIAIDRDPELQTPRGEAIRAGLEAFGCWEAAGLSRSG